MTNGAESAAHWNRAYDLGDTTRSWFQDNPTQSLRMFDTAGVTSADGLVDIGGGASVLVDALLARGLGGVTVLDISPVGLDAAKARLRGDADGVSWLVLDLLEWRPVRTYGVWHDRAVFHFPTTAEARASYTDTLRSATEVGSVAVFGCFALDGPESCSGLPVARYDVAGLGEELGPEWTPIAHEREEHRTPGGGVQPFTWVSFRRQGAG
jgi:hypothetical protein